MRKYLFNKSWFIFFGFYIVVFIFFFACWIATADEYTRGNDALVDYGSDIFNYVFGFPLFYLDRVMPNNAVPDFIILPVFLFQFALNSLLFVTPFNFLYLKFLKRA